MERSQASVNRRGRPVARKRSYLHLFSSFENDGGEVLGRASSPSDLGGGNSSLTVRSCAVAIALVAL